MNWTRKETYKVTVRLQGGEKLCIRGLSPRYLEETHNDIREKNMDISRHEQGDSVTFIFWSHVQSVTFELE